MTGRKTNRPLRRIESERRGVDEGRNRREDVEDEDNKRKEKRDVQQTVEEESRARHDFGESRVVVQLSGTESPAVVVIVSTVVVVSSIVAVVDAGDEINIARCSDVPGEREKTAVEVDEREVDINEETRWTKR